MSECKNESTQCSINRLVTAELSDTRSDRMTCRSRGVPRGSKSLAWQMLMVTVLGRPADRRYYFLAR